MKLKVRAFLSVILLIFHLTACTNDDNNSLNSINRKPTGNWNTEFKYSQDNSSVELLLESYCIEFHDDAPQKGQKFNATSTSNPFLRAYSMYYNAQYSFCANSYGIKLLDKQRIVEKQYYDNSKSEFKKLAHIEFIDKSINDLFNDLINEPMPDDKYIFENLFQIALWIETNDIQENEIDEENFLALEDLSSSLIKNENNKDKVESIINSLKSVMTRYYNELYKNASILTNLLRQFETFSSFDNIIKFYSVCSIDLINAQKLGLIEYEMDSTGNFTGKSIWLRINSLVNEPVNIKVPASLINNPAGSTRQTLNSFDVQILQKKHITMSSGYIKLRNRFMSKYVYTKSGASVQSMMSVSSINNIHLNDPTLQTNTYQSNRSYIGNITFLGSDENGSSAEDTSTGSQFIINKFDNNNTSERDQAEAIIVNEIITFEEKPSILEPFIHITKLENDKVIIYCYGIFETNSDIDLNQFGVNYGVFDTEAGNLIAEIAKETPSIVTDANLFKTLTWLHQLDVNCTQNFKGRNQIVPCKSLVGLLEIAKNSSDSLLEEISNFLKESECNSWSPDNPECYSIDINPNFTTIQKCYDIWPNDQQITVCIYYLVKDNTEIVDLTYEYSEF